MSAAGCLTNRRGSRTSEGRLRHPRSITISRTPAHEPCASRLGGLAKANDETFSAGGGGQEAAPVLTARPSKFEANGRRSSLLPHLVAKRHHAALIGSNLEKVQGDVLVEPLEKRDSITEQNGHDRIAHFVGQSAAQALTG